MQRNEHSMSDVDVPDSIIVFIPEPSLKVLTVVCATEITGSILYCISVAIFCYYNLSSCISFQSFLQL